jgi:microcystin-dependent protein
MADPFVAEIRIFPFNFAPKGWAWCDGQLLPISQNTALFSLVGTFYGGDGKSTFALPDLQGDAPMHTGADQPGPGLSTHYLGETGGEQNVTLLETELPAHAHGYLANTVSGDTNAPSPNVSLTRASNATPYQTVTNQNLVNFAIQAVGPTGGSQPHNNMQPFLTLYYNIALQGVFPARP